MTSVENINNSNNNVSNNNNNLNTSQYIETPSESTEGIGSPLESIEYIESSVEDAEYTETFLDNVEDKHKAWEDEIIRNVSEEEQVTPGNHKLKERFAIFVLCALL